MNQDSRLVSLLVDAAECVAERSDPETSRFASCCSRGRPGLGKHRDGRIEARPPVSLLRQSRRLLKKLPDKLISFGHKGWIGERIRHARYCQPFADSVDPVMNPAASDARNTTARAISSGRPRRPTGIAGRITSFITFSGMVPIISVAM